MVRKCFEAADSIDASNRLVGAYRSTRHRAECHSAMGLLQFVKCCRAVFELRHCLLDLLSIARAVAIERTD